MVTPDTMRNREQTTLHCTCQRQIWHLRNQTRLQILRHTSAFKPTILPHVINPRKSPASILPSTSTPPHLNSPTSPFLLPLPTQSQHASNHSTAPTLHDLRQRPLPA